MSRTSATARFATTLTAGAALAALSVPALAAAQPYPDPADPAGGGTHRDTGAARDRIDEPRVDVGRQLNEIEAPTTSRTAVTPPAPPQRTVVVDDGSPEPVQIVGGALAVALLVGGGATIAARRRHGQPPHPA